MPMYFAGPIVQTLPNASVVDLTAPTFAGISGLTANANGSLQASWAAATDPTLPIRYDIYVQAATATGLFNSPNRALGVFGTTKAIFALADGTLLQAGVTYYVGVKAVDGVGNVDGNSASLNAVAVGVPDTSLFNLFSTVADQVWNAPLGLYQAAGTMGFNENLIDDIKGTVDGLQASDTDHHVVVPSTLGIPASGSAVYRFYFRNSNDGQPANPAVGPEIQIELADATVLTAWASMTAESTGLFYYDFTVLAADSEAQIVVKVRHKEVAPDPFTIIVALAVRTAGSSTTDEILAQTTSIKAKTDQIALTGGRVDAVLAAAERDDIVDRVWDEAQAGHVAAGTTGKRLDEDMSSRAPALTAVLNTDLTPARAAKLDLVDVAVSTRATPADVAASVNIYDNLMSTTFDSLTDSQTIIAWATKNGQRVSGTNCTVTVKDNSGATVWTATLASPNSDGVFKFTNVNTLVGSRDYYVVVAITVDAAVRTSQKPFVTVE